MREGTAGQTELHVFDWEFVCVGHPFYDTHELHPRLSAEARSTYLSHFVTRGARDVEALYGAGRTLGWCAKMWHVLDIAALCDVELVPTARTAC